MNAFNRNPKNGAESNSCNLEKVLDYFFTLVSALQGNNGVGKTSNSHHKPTRSSDALNVEYRQLYGELSKLKKILDIIRSMLLAIYIVNYFLVAVILFMLLCLW